MSAEHVAEQRTEMPGELPREALGRRARVSVSATHGVFELERLLDPGGELRGPVGSRAQRSEALREHLREGVLVLQQRPQGEEVVSERLVGARALAPELVTLERPG